MKGFVRAYKLDDAQPKWTADFRTNGGAVADLALLDSGVLAVPSLDRNVYFLDSETGAEKYPAAKLEDWAWGVPAVDGDRVVLTDISGNVYAFNLVSGSMDWMYATEHRLKASPTIVETPAGTIVVVADRSPEIHFLDLNSGDRRNSVPLDGVRHHPGQPNRPRGSCLLHHDKRTHYGGGSDQVCRQ